MKSWNDLSGHWLGLTTPERQPRYRAIAETIDRLRPKAAVLDVGCGEALLSDCLPREAKYFGIDPSAKAVESARVKHRGECILHTSGEEFEGGGNR